MNAYRPLVDSLPRGGECLPRGCLPRRVSAQRGRLPEGVSAPWGCLPRGGVCPGGFLPGGSAQEGVSATYPGTRGRHPVLRGQTDTRHKLRLRAVKNIGHSEKLSSENSYMSFFNPFNFSFVTLYDSKMPVHFLQRKFCTQMGSAARK